MTPKEKVINLLAKLQRHKESAEKVGNREEAEAFAAKISEMLLKHKLSMSQVELLDELNNAEIKEDLVGRREMGDLHGRKRVQWMERLASIVARNNFCRTLIMEGTNSVWFVGREGDRQVCSYLFLKLAREIKALSEKEYGRAYYQAEKAGDTSSMRRFSASWRDGAIDMLSRRFKDIRQTAMDAAATRGAAAVAKNALILKQDTAVVGYIDKKYKSKSAGLQGQYGGNLEGYASGATWGATAEIQRGIGEGKTDSSRRIT